MKRILSIGLVFAGLIFSHLASANTSDEKIYLKCRPDTSERLPGGVDLLFDTKKLEAVLFPVNESRKFVETDTEYQTKTEIDGKLFFELVINKYTLRFRNYNMAALIVGGNPTIAGQCTIQDKKL